MDHNTATAGDSDHTPPSKKTKLSLVDEAALANIPRAECYDRSFLHRDIMLQLATSNDCIVSVSYDGHIVFWQRDLELGLVPIKRVPHLGKLMHATINFDGSLLCSIGLDIGIHVFCTKTYQPLNFLNLEYTASFGEWVHGNSDSIAALAVIERDSSVIRIYDGRKDTEPLIVLDSLLANPIVLLKFNPVFDAVIAVDQSGVVEYFGTAKDGYKFPTSISWSDKKQTDLCELETAYLLPFSAAVSPDGKCLAILADKKIRVFCFDTGKIIHTIDESVRNLTLQQILEPRFDSEEFDRRLRLEQQLGRCRDSLRSANLIFDHSGEFLIYATPVGIKVVGAKTGQLARLIGNKDNYRFLCVTLSSGMCNADSKTPLDTGKDELGPALLSTAFESSRIFLFTNPHRNNQAESERDVGDESYARIADASCSRPPVSFKLPRSPNRSVSSPSRSSQSSSEISAVGAAALKKLKDLARRPDVDKALAIDLLTHTNALEVEFNNCRSSRSRYKSMFGMLNSRLEQASTERDDAFKQRDDAFKQRDHWQREFETLESATKALKKRAANIQNRCLLEELANHVAHKHEGRSCDLARVLVAEHDARQSATRHSCEFAPQYRTDDPTRLTDHMAVLRHFAGCRLFVAAGENPNLALRKVLESSTFDRRSVKVIGICPFVPTWSRFMPNKVDNYTKMLQHIIDCSLFSDISKDDLEKTEVDDCEKVKLILKDVSGTDLYTKYNANVHNLNEFGSTIFVNPVDPYSDVIVELYNAVFKAKHYKLDILND